MKLYLILAMRTPAFDPGVLPAHRDWLDGLAARGVLEAFGPFADQSGGAYLVRAEDLAAARAIADADPVHRSGASTMTVREWAITRVAETQPA